MTLDPDPVAGARQLLGATLARGTTAVRITEVEAYAGAGDPASHAFRGPTRRNAVMFGPAGRLYVYAMHGHFCANVICTPQGVGGGVLIRAGEVVEGIEHARERRPGVADPKLARGPGNLTRALGISLADNGAELLTGDSAVQVRLATIGPGHVSAGPRVGVSRAADVAWRFWVTGDPSVSAYRPARTIVRPGPGSE
ncbi:MAG: DNA-3-methyladenine glycosylase [Propionibacteriaceae bacterium]|nr:DNA-3-methyladenine glycosylase [Propionibacteriaceae bacterium]